ncbi:MAG: sulfurtransferase TusA family protein, partial [Acidobacteria bacterium]|nr:sulfurtransferase TusA family protein [Acidobacteriota bacterium]
PPQKPELVRGGLSTAGREADRGEPPAHEECGVRPDGRLDTVGFFCPIPIIKTNARIRGMQEGETLEVISDDRVILVDLPNWCRGTGHEYLGYLEDEREIHLFVKKRGRKASPSQGKERESLK